MDSAQATLRRYINILVEAADDSSRRPKVTKTERLRTVNDLKHALGRKSTISSLSAASSLEMIRGPQEEAGTSPPVGWAELAAVLVETLQQTNTDALKSRSKSKTKSFTLKRDFILCFRMVIKEAISNGPSGVIRPVVPAFLYFAAEWLAKELVRDVIADDIWQCVRDLLQDDSNRAMLTPPFIRSWLSICVQQLTKRGPILHDSPLAAKFAAEVMEILARSPVSFDVLTQSTKNLAPSKMPGGEFGYAAVCEQACLLVLTSISMSSKRDARELQSVAFRTLTTALSEHALDVVGSNALKSIINLCLNPLLSCWTDRRHHESAVALASVLLRLAPSHKQLFKKCRQRILVDLREEKSSAVVRTGHQVRDAFVEVAAVCFSFRESLNYFVASDAGQGKVVVWLRVAYSILSRRVLKRGMNLLTDHTDVMDQCILASTSITSVFKAHNDIGQSLYPEIIRWGTRLVDSVAVLANKIHVNFKAANPEAVQALHGMYSVVREHLTKVSLSFKTKRAQYSSIGEAVHADVHLLQSASLMAALDVFDPTTLRNMSTNEHVGRGITYPISKLASTEDLPLPSEIEYLRNTIARCGLSDRDGGHLRLRLIHSLVSLCNRKLPSTEKTAYMLLDGSSAAIGLARGECSSRIRGGDKRQKSLYSYRWSRNHMLKVFNAFQRYFCQSPGEDKILGVGQDLVHKLGEQEVLFGSQELSCESLFNFRTNIHQSIQTIRKELRNPGKSAYFAVEPSLSLEIETQLFEKFQDLVDTEVFLNEEEEAYIAGYRGASNTAVAVRLILFFTNYVLEGVICGSISFSEISVHNASAPCSRIFCLLIKLVKSLAFTNVELLVPLHELCVTVVYLLTRLYSVADQSKKASQYSSVQASDEVLNIIAESLVSLSKGLCKWLIKFLVNNSQDRLKRVQVIASGRFPRDDFSQKSRKKRSRSGSDRSYQALEKKRRRVSNVSSQNGSEASEHIRGRLADRNTGLDEEEQDSAADSDGSLSDDFGNDSFQNTTKKSRESNGNSRENTSVQQQIQGVTSILVLLLQETPECRDAVQEVCVYGIEKETEAERVLSADGFERAALASDLLGQFYINLRESLWQVLLSLKTAKGLEILGNDLIKVGTHWKGLEDVAHGYVSFYLESLQISSTNRKSYPMSDAMEFMRISFLEHSRVLMGLLIPNIESANRSSSRSIQLPTPHVIYYLLERLVDVSEHFRLKHAFRMPRLTRIAYMCFGISALRLFNEKSIEGNASAGSESIEASSLRETVQSIQSALFKFLSDPEAIVRVAASKSIPLMVSSFAKAPASQLEKRLQDSIPQTLACVDGELYFGHANMTAISADLASNADVPPFDLTEQEEIGHISVLNSIETVGSQAKACSAFLTLTEAATMKESLIPFAVVQILVRVAKQPNLAPAAYQMLVRLCAARGHRSPRQLFRTFARLVLHMWFKDVQGIELLYSLPVSVLVDKDHHTDTMLYDWLRDNQADLIPYLLLNDEIPSFSVTTRFATTLGTNIRELMLSNAGSVALIFPMIFIRHLHEKGRSLWSAIENVIDCPAEQLMVNDKAAVIRCFLRSVSCGVYGTECRQEPDNLPKEESVFFREAADIRPPLYDPLVIASAINAMFDTHPEIIALPKNVLRGSLFMQVSDESTGSVIVDQFHGFIVESQKGRVLLMRNLIHVAQFLKGPPFPVPAQNQLDGFFCVGMLWRMLGVNVLVQSSVERVMFYRLLSKGFEQAETVVDAAWLLHEVQEKVINLASDYPDVQTSFEDISADDETREYLHCLSTNQERQMFELIGAVCSVLLSVATSWSAAQLTNLQKIATKSLRRLLELCHNNELWSVIVCNGPIPNLKHLDSCVRLYETARNLIETNYQGQKAGKLILSLDRFQGIYRLRFGLRSTTALLACLDEVASLLTDSSVKVLREKIIGEGWVRSDGQNHPSLPRINQHLSALVHLACDAGVKLQQKGLKGWVTATRSSDSTAAGSPLLLTQILHKCGHVLSVLGLLHPESVISIAWDRKNSTIPSLPRAGRFEDVESGIEICFFSLMELLREDSAVSAEAALSAILGLLRSEDGKKWFQKERSRLHLFQPFLKTARKLGAVSRTDFSASPTDPFTGEVVEQDSFPGVFDNELWAADLDETSTGCLEFWMRRLCFVLSYNCNSGAMRAVSSACFSSYRLSCELFPYLLMNTVAHLDTDSVSKLSSIIREELLINPKVPPHILRTIVHALDVLCQMGSNVMYQNGISHWLGKDMDSKFVRFRYALNIPYEQTAAAALRSGSYFSVIRFAQMYVDQELYICDLNKGKAKTKAPRRKSISASRDPDVEYTEHRAKQRIASLVKEAMANVKEYDGIRAFGHSERLATAVSDLALLDRNWARALSSLDISGRDTHGRNQEDAMEDVSRSHGTNTLDVPSKTLRRELSVLQSFAGLGMLSTAIDYWDGLRLRLLSQSKSQRTNFPVEDFRERSKLNDFRFSLAWKLGQWESPPMLPHTAFRRTGRNREYGFHESLHRILSAVRFERWSETSLLLKQAKHTEMLSLVNASLGASSTSIFQVSARLRLFKLLEAVLQQNNTSLDFLSQYSPFIDLVCAQDASDSSNALLNRDFVQEQMCVSNVSRNQKDENALHCIIEGLKHFQNDNFIGRDPLYTDPFTRSMFTDELPIALVSVLQKKKLIPQVAALVSLKIFTEGGNGSWERAASCLELASDKALQSASQINCVSWKLQQARLRWFASHDASSKKQALGTVIDIINKDLGGSAPRKRSEMRADFSQEPIFWESDDQHTKEYASLRLEACVMATKWSLDMKTQEPISLFALYLGAGLRAVACTEDKQLSGRAHLEMAIFADHQLANIDAYRKTPKYSEMVTAIRESEDRIEKLQTVNKNKKISAKTPGRRNSRSRLSGSNSTGMADKVGKDLDYYIRDEQKKTLLDRNRLERLQKYYMRWRILACKHFASCLRYGCAHDLRAAFRLVAIWLDSGVMREAVTKALLQGSSGREFSKMTIGVPGVKLLPLAPQLCSRLDLSANVEKEVFQKALSGVIYEMASEFPVYCLWQLIALSNSTRVAATHEKYSSLYRGDKDKKDASDRILNKLQQDLGDKVLDAQRVADAYIKLSEAKGKPRNADHFNISSCDLLKIGELPTVPVPTVPLPLDGSLCARSLPHIVSFEKRAGICSGLSRPLRIVCIASDGKSYPQMVKGRDDLRGDAVMEQMFTILNSLLEKDAEASKRNLLVRTYRIIPLSPFSGIMQFVSNTLQLKDVLTEKSKSKTGKSMRKSLHERYRPYDMGHEAIQEKVFRLRKPTEQTKRVDLLRNLWNKIQPVFRFFFLEQWADPMEWFTHQLAYARSVAVMSMVGFVLGLGDRHLSNILLDVFTGEVVHIDFGIAFEQGQLLPTPEQMPFRLTRDVVDGFGMAGVEGSFRKCSEVTLNVMRKHKDVLLTVVQVLLHDPMFSWDLAPEVVIREQLSLDSGNDDISGSDDPSNSTLSDADAMVQKVNRHIKGSSSAQRALNRISEKLDGLEGTERLSVEAHVARLIDEAQAFHVIASVYPGWSPWI